jgi:hypothetical protein
MTRPGRLGLVAAALPGNASEVMRFLITNSSIGVAYSHAMFIKQTKEYLFA